MAGRHELGLAGWNSDNSDPDNFLYSLLDPDNISEAGNNLSRYRSDRFHELMLAGQRELDEAKRLAIYREAQELVRQGPARRAAGAHQAAGRPRQAAGGLQAASDGPRPTAQCRFVEDHRAHHEDKSGDESAVIGYLARRVVHALATIVVAVALVFIAMRALPGNPLLARFGQHPDAQQIDRAAQAIRLGPARARAARPVLLAGADDGRPGPVARPHQRQRQPRAAAADSRHDRADGRRAAAGHSAGHCRGPGGRRLAQSLARPPVDGACRWSA